MEPTRLPFHVLPIPSLFVAKLNPPAADFVLLAGPLNKDLRPRLLQEEALDQSFTSFVAYSLSCLRRLRSLFRPSNTSKLEYLLK